jgi:hypothetical protein
MNNFVTKSGGEIYAKAEHWRRSTVNPGWVCELVPWEAPEAPSAQYCLKAAKASIVPVIYKIQFLARLLALHKL